MGEKRVVRRVLMAEVNGGRVRGRQRLSWIDGVNVALGNRGMTLEADKESGELWGICILSFQRPFLLGPVFFRTALPCSGGYHLERGWDAVT